MPISAATINLQAQCECSGGRYFDERDLGAVSRRTVKRLEKLGYQV